MSRTLIALLVVASVLAGLTWRKRKLERDLRNEVEAVDRYVDFGIKLHVVVADPNGEEPIEGKRLRILRTHRFGGIVDTKLEKPQIVGPSLDPVVWFCSEDQESALIHHSATCPAQLVHGSEGAGKTTALAMWHALQVLAHLGEGREGLQTSPTLKRLGLVKLEIAKLWRASWFRFLNRKDFEGVEVCDGTLIRMVSTHRQSEAQGSPIQGFNSSWAGEDEGQDSIDEHDNVTARLRAAKGGASKAPRLKTASAKDNAKWRDLRDSLERSGLWIRRTLLGPRSPFVDASHWVAMRSSMSEREYKRRVLAMDLPPEKATYPDWGRDTNMIEVNDFLINVTEEELARANGPHLRMLVGHDPGNSIDVSLLGQAFVPRPQYQAYRRGIFKPWWVIRGEINTEGTTEGHIAEFLKTIQSDPWRLNLQVRDERTGRYRPPTVADPVPQVLVRADPAGDTDTRTDKTVYTQFINAGVRIKPAAYNAANDGHGRVPREAGVELVNTLICNAAGERRLYVERLPDGRPAAPRLVAALESSERDDSGRAEIARVKGGRSDTTHWPAGLRYMLWAIERPRLQLVAREDLT